MRKLSLSLLTLAACTGPGSDPGSANARWTLTHYLAAVSRLPEEPTMKTQAKRSQPWDVYKGDRWIDRVFFVPGMTSEEVKRALVNHDGYDTDISVFKP